MMVLLSRERHRERERERESEEREREKERVKEEENRIFQAPSYTNICKRLTNTESHSFIYSMGTNFQQKIRKCTV